MSMFNYNATPQLPKPERVSHLYLFGEVTLLSSALFVLFGTAKLLPHWALPWQLSLPLSYASFILYILVVKLLLRRYRIRHVSSIALTALQACWVTIYLLGISLILILNLKS